MKRSTTEPLIAPDGSGLADTYVTILIFGPNGCGKTTVAEQLAHFYVRGTNVRGKAWAIDPNGAFEKSEEVKSLWDHKLQEEGVDVMLMDCRRWGPGLLIFDDADAYIRFSTRIQRNALTSNRHQQKDQIVIARRPQGIPKDAIASAKAVFLFAGSLTEVGARDYLEGVFPEEILNAVPKTEHHYLKIVRSGAKWSYERGKTAPRKIRTAGDKS
jgi:hypothetical protein